MSINNNDVYIHNRAANGKVIIQANTSTAGANDVTAATFEDDKVTFAVQPVLPSAGIKFSDGSQQTVAASAGGASFLDGAELIDLPHVQLNKLFPYGGLQAWYGNPFTSYVQYYPFIAPKSGTARSMGMRTNTQGDDQDVYVGIYSDTNGSPDSLLGKVEFSVDSNAAHTSTQWAVSAPTLVKGVQYWVAWLSDDASASNSYYGSSKNQVPIIYSGAGGISGSPRLSVRSNNNASSLPSSASGISGYWPQGWPDIYLEFT
jgi:hypothetical protein